MGRRDEGIFFLRSHISKILVTGGLGFIGSAFIRYILRSTHASIVNLDKITYAADWNSLNGFHENPRYFFIQGDICNFDLVEKLCFEREIDAIVHFAAETHVDRSIEKAFPFIETNIMGTMNLLEVVRKFPSIHFHHISTDEVYGSLGDEGLFTENSPYRPNSPYSASKASSDHLVRSYAHTYNLSTTLSHCSNNYGPFQNREKFIPRMICHCLERKTLPIYGHGSQVRDWIYVEDHVEAVWKILQSGRKGETYNIGGNCEMKNLEVLEMIFQFLSEKTSQSIDHYRSLIQFVKDRPGHDFRYAIDSTKILKKLGWAPKTSLKKGLLKTVQWFSRQFYSVE